MATVAANRSIEIPFLDKVSIFAGKLTERLLGSTSLAPVKNVENPFGNFGVLAAADKFKANTKPLSKTSFFFNIDDAKKRLSELVENKFKPEKFSDLMEYIGDRFMKLETWVLKAGPLNMLVDTQSSRAVPAAEVSPALSYINTLILKLRGDLRREIGTTPPSTAFSSWEGMMMVLGNSSNHLGYTVSNGQAFLGKVYADQNDSRTFDEIVEAADREGVKLVLPTLDGTASGKHVHGLPYLVAMQSLKAEVVHEGMKHDDLAMSFGGNGLIDVLNSKVSAKAARNAMEANGGVQEAFDISQFIRREPEMEIASTIDNNSSDFYDSFDENIEVARDLTLRSYAPNSDNFVIYDRDFGEATQIDFKAMPEGKYPRESYSGKLEGYTEILSGGELKHFDLNGKELEFTDDNDNAHNQFGR